MDFKAIPSRRSNRNIGSTTDAEVKYKPGRCVRHGLHTSLVHMAPVACKVLTLGGGGAGRRRRRVGVSERRASDVRCPQRRNAENGEPSAARRAYASTPRGWGGVIAPRLFQLAGRNSSGEPGVVDDAARCAARRDICQSPAVIWHLAQGNPPTGANAGAPARKCGTDTLPSTRRASLLQHERTMKCE